MIKFGVSKTDFDSVYSYIEAMKGNTFRAFMEGSPGPAYFTTIGPPFDWAFAEEIGGVGGKGADPQLGLSTSLRDSCHLFGTIQGMVGSVIVLSEDLFKFFSSLQMAMKSVVQGVGVFTHDDWRSFHNDRRSGKKSTTIDGDLIEHFLELSKFEMEEVVLRLNDDIRGKASESDPSSSGSSSASIFATVEAAATASATAVVTVEEVIMRVEDIARAH